MVVLCQKTTAMALVKTCRIRIKFQWSRLTMEFDKNKLKPDFSIKIDEQCRLMRIDELDSHGQWLLTYDLNWTCQTLELLAW